MRDVPGQRHRPLAASEGGADVIGLRSRAGYRPDMAALARQQVASARRRLALSPHEFAEVLASLLGWLPTAEMVDSWETTVAPPGDVLLAAGVAIQATPREAGDRADPDVVTQLVGRRFADVEAVYPTRSEFAAQMPPHALFDNAREIRTAGLSLNLLCQHYADDRLRTLIAAGTVVRCLFLNPAGEATKAREREEEYEPGHLAALTDLNISILRQRVRQRLPEEARPRLMIATYDETIRFNLTLVDNDLAVVQPYLHAARGVESPTLLIRRRSSASGLYSTFEQTFEWLWGRSTAL